MAPHDKWQEQVYIEGNSRTRIIDMGFMDLIVR